MTTVIISNLIYSKYSNKGNTKVITINNESELNTLIIAKERNFANNARNRVTAPVVGHLRLVVRYFLFYD